MNRYEFILNRIESDSGKNYETIKAEDLVETTSFGFQEFLEVEQIPDTLFLELVNFLQIHEISGINLGHLPFPTVGFSISPYHGILYSPHGDAEGKVGYSKVKSLGNDWYEFEREDDS